MNLTELGYGAAFSTLKTLPKPLVWAAFRAAADRSARTYRAGKPGKGTARLAANLRRVVGEEMPQPEFEALVQAALRSYSRYYMDAFRLPGSTEEQRRAGVRVDRSDLLTAAVAAGRGVVMALPHSGNWDAAGAWVAANGWKIITVAERLKPEGVYRRFLEFRRQIGMEIIPLTGGERPALDVLEERIHSGYVVPLLAERDLSARGIEVNFFGGRTRMPAGPALLALRTGAPLFVVSGWYEGALPCNLVEGPVELPVEGNLEQRVRATTQLVADGIAAGIARHPADWHMLQRMWLD